MPRKGALVDSTDKFEKALEDAGREHYLLRLYIAGNSARSNQAVLNIRKFCEEHLKGRYKLEVIDVYQQPTLAEGEQIIAAPTLIKKLPLPLRRMIGDMSQTDRILLGLDLRQLPSGRRDAPAARKSARPRTVRKSRPALDGSSS